jgi:hypothetical protein
MFFKNKYDEFYLLKFFSKINYVNLTKISSVFFCFILVVLFSFNILFNLIQRICFSIKTNFLI